MQPGERFADRFEIEAEVASGGMGRVLRAQDRVSGQRVALKVALANTYESAARMLREGELLAELAHPNIVGYVAHGRTATGETFIAMDWLEGMTLSARLANGVLDLRDGVLVAAQIAEALAAMHRRGLVHRDVKPENVFLASGDVGAVRLLDLGIARALASDVRLTRTGMILGTPYYMAPEQVRAGRSIDVRADVFALGCVLFESVTGRPPFEGNDVLSVFARILLDDPPLLGTLRPDAPESLELLVASMLAKEPEARPHDGDAVARSLHALRFETTPAPRAMHAEKAALSDSEQRTLSVLVVGVITGDDSTMTPDQLDSTHDVVRRIAERRGGRVESLREGSALVVLEPHDGGVASDQAEQAARVACEVRVALPESPIALATGLARAGVALPAGEVIARVTRLTPHARGGEVILDEATAHLLRGRFVVESRDAHWLLVGPRREHQAERLLLGKPTSCVGRDREAVVVMGLITEAFDERVPRAAIVTAVAGAGKTRLCAEILMQLSASDRAPCTILRCRAETLASGSPYALLSQTIHAAAGFLDGQDMATQRSLLASRLARVLSGHELDSVACFLGVACGIDPEGEQAAVHAALRHDGARLGEAIRGAVRTWLAAECRIGPVCWILDDLHWGDLPTVQAVDAVLRDLPDMPLAVLALARPEVHTQFPNLWSERGVQEIRLSPLSPRACERLIQQVLGERADRAMIDWITSNAKGNAFHLEELIRSAGEGNAHGALPESVLAMVEARIAGLDDGAKRALRAASVFGETFWLEGVTTLLGGRSNLELERTLERIAPRELIEMQPQARFPSTREAVFRHALVREAVYRTLTDDDRSVGHRLAGLWLEQAGESDPVLLAEHFARGKAPALAASWFHRAAEQALAGNDYRGVLDRVKRAIECGAGGHELGALRLHEAVAHGLLGNLPQSLDASLQAMDLLPRGEEAWFRAAGEAIACLGRHADRDGLVALTERVRDEAERGPVHAAAITALSRAIIPLLLHGAEPVAIGTLARVREMLAACSDVDLLTRAQFAEADAEMGFTRLDLGGSIASSEAAIAAWEALGQTRDLAAALASAAATMMMADPMRGHELCERSRRLAKGLGAQRVIAWAALASGQVDCELGRLESAEQHTRVAIELYFTQGNRYFEVNARTLLARLHLLNGRNEEALVEARRASEAAPDAQLPRSVALALQARALLRLGRLDEARMASKAAYELAFERAQGEMLESAFVAHSEVAWASGDAALGRSVACEALGYYDAMAATLGREDWGRVFRARTVYRELSRLAGDAGDASGGILS